ncbi:hypothetical protein A2348_01420 [Candidatus Uhrbacteria bacterium RIFOXYB12_FULL_58_10]|uniref:Bacterial Ig-like domain-containing protein n=1 Tax=Candidatus Uhrbacteria bacterium RIFOXYB2_FULL_57_15 TaxID=1802422 RepID=A0A1F7W5F8_9BACT|nr:MAG: hypothetical protein A2348_01420 [Candidatus Uhrbacteria bacterium RIFOXYB12_FULL_58_10]OGL98042.1 MAG: hypothetical protein A2304_00850 [Candidatus Uhrbacteria bacterium RIFOXYB2_FULL_57_15]OGL99286.1 MAG: hypothetical protein A2501_03940 [Candidatus Uhrbacteria bacterium RIFOXYC12_FULL_57_11]
MRYAWLNLVLRLSNRIYQRKQRVVSQEGLAAVGNVFVLICLELILAFFSLPLYLNLKPQKITAYFEERGSYSKIIFDYNLRRILTLTGVGIFLAIWLVKLLLILLAPTVLGTPQLYRVSELRPPDLLTVDMETVAAESDIQASRISSDLIVPELTQVRKSGGKDFVFYGTGAPNSTVVLLLSDLQTAVYTGEADQNGNWKIEHLNENFKLNEGNHSILTFTLDQEEKTRSDFSSEQYFKVRTTFLDMVIRNVDVLANWSVIILLSVGVFLTFLTL